MGKLAWMFGWWLAAALTFWGIFFKLTPIITGLIPTGEWHSLLRVITYIVVGYLGGIGLPIAFIIIGLYVWIIN